MTASERAIELTVAAAEAAGDKLAQNIVAFDVSDHLAITDVFLVCSAATDRQVGAIVDGIERRLQEMGEKEIPTTFVGESVMRELSRLDEVAYVRFASVYRSFKDVGEFMSELKELIHERKGKQK